MHNYESTIAFPLPQDGGVKLRNFWEPEDGFVWSRGRWCEMVFAFDAGNRPGPRLADLILDMDAFRVDGRHELQNALVYLNGLRIGSFAVTRRATFYAAFEPKLLYPVDNVLVIDTPDAASPREFGGEDVRSLGIKLYSVRLRRGA